MGAGFHRTSPVIRNVPAPKNDVPVAITGLQPAGTSIPGNDGYPVDGLIRTEAPQLSLHGFAYALADGTYANLFYGDHFVPPGVYAFSSDPANRKTSEPLVKFTATIVP